MSNTIPKLIVGTYHVPTTTTNRHVRGAGSVTHKTWSVEGFEQGGAFTKKWHATLFADFVSNPDNLTEGQCPWVSFEIAYAPQQATRFINFDTWMV